MATVYQVLKHLADTPSRKEKESILNDAVQNNHLVKEVFMTAYDPRLNFYIKDDTLFADQSVSTVDRLWRDSEFNTFESLDMALDDLRHIIAKRVITGDKAKAQIRAQYFALSEDDREVYKRVVLKDLRCGASASTFNKVFPKTIYEHPYMRCSGFSEKSLKNISFPCYSQVKMDGLYVDVAVDYDGNVKCYTRSGQDVTHYLREEDIIALRSFTYTGSVLQGEVLVRSEDGSASYLDRKTGNGYLNSDDVDPSRLEFVIWDCVEYDAWIQHETFYDGYKDRLEDASNIIKDLSDSFTLISTTECYDADDIMTHFKTCRLAGNEGTVIKNLYGVWKSGTSKDQVKIKVVADFDLKVTGYKLGKGKHEGKLGAITCETSDGLLEVSVGGGFTDQQREDILNVIDDYIEQGVIVAVLGNDVIKDISKEDSKWSIFLPRFVEFRFDKTEPDSLEQCQQQVASFVDALKLIKNENN